MLPHRKIINTESDLHFLMLPFWQLVHDGAIVAKKWERILLELAIPPIDRHALFECTDRRIGSRDTDFICESFQDREAFTNALLLRLRFFQRWHPSFWNVSFA